MNRFISGLSGALEMLTAISGISLTIYVMFFSWSRVLFKRALDFGFSHQPLGILLFILYLCLFFIIGATILFPFSVRTDARKEADLKYLYSVAAMGLGPWLDVLVTSIKEGFGPLNIDRVAVMYIGVGALAMLLAALSGKAPSKGGAFAVASVAFAGFATLYAGLWIAGGMGNLFGILVWHGVMLYSGFSAFQEWLWFMRERSSR
ncbi:MAG: hypothetical protein ABIM88_09115 [candidate division WOR-3 bacterium]